MCNASEHGVSFPFSDEVHHLLSPGSGPGELVSGDAYQGVLGAYANEERAGEGRILGIIGWLDPAEVLDGTTADLLATVAHAAENDHNRSAGAVRRCASSRARSAATLDPYRDCIERLRQPASAIRFSPSTPSAIRSCAKV